MDPLIKSQLAPLEYQWLAGKLLAFSGIADQTVTIQMQTANWDLQDRVPPRRAIVQATAPDNHLPSCAREIDELLFGAFESFHATAV